MEPKAAKKSSRSRQARNRPRHNSARDQPTQQQPQPQTSIIPTPSPNQTNEHQQSSENVVIDLPTPVEEQTTTPINVETAPIDVETILINVEPETTNNQQVAEEKPILETAAQQDSMMQPEPIPTGCDEEQSKDILINVEPHVEPHDEPCVEPHVEPQVETSIVVEAHEPDDETSKLIQDSSAPQPVLPLEQPLESEPENISLPDTITRLNTANGAEVYLLGTAHFSPNSVKDVQAVMRHIRPNAVVLELCRERAFMLSLNEAELLEQNKNLTFDKVRSAIAQKGLAQGLIYIMFIKMSATLTEKLGMAPGAEFRAGATEAQQLGCSIVLGDRSLKVTLARAVASVSTWQKMKLIYQVLTSDAGMTQEEVEKCKDKDILEQLLQELGVEFPGFKRVILDERNIYLAHTIYHHAQQINENSILPRKVVAIVGIGHVSGIVENWGKTKTEDIAQLNEIPKVSKTRRFVSKTIKYCSIALLVYVGYRVIVPSSIQNSVIEKISSHVKQ